MKRFMKRLHRGEKGFTLIELLIVIAILGIIAAIVVPNVAGFMISGNLNAANTEVANVKTAAVGYLAEEGTWPATSDVLGDFLGGTPKVTYTFMADNSGQIASALPVDWDGAGLQWNVTDQIWERIPSS